MAIMNKIGSGLKYAFKPPTLGEMGGDTIKRAHEFRKSAFNQLKQKRDYRVETFEEAVNRLGLTEENIIRRRWELLVEARIYYTALVSFFLITFYLAATGSGIMIVLAGLFSCVFPAVLAIVKSFRIDQIDKRELYAFKLFFSRPEAWIK